jgi:hypothetical protein
MNWRFLSIGLVAKTVEITCRRISGRMGSLGRIHAFDPDENRAVAAAIVRNL